MVALEGTDTEEVTKLIMASAELAGRQEASKVARTCIGRGLRRAKECLGRGQIASLAQHHI